MELRVRVVRPSDFLHLKPTGVMDRETTIKTLEKIVLLNADREDIMLDLRNAETGAMSPIDIVDVVDFMLDHVDTFGCKIAILAARRQDGDSNEFLKKYGMRRGLKIRPFDNYEEAIEWLGRTDEII
jgi:hypothetical protein